MSNWQLVGIGATSTVTTNNVTPAEPAGAQQGDLLVISIGYRSAAGGSDFSADAAWTQAGVSRTDNTLTTTSAVASGQMFYMIRGASAPSYALTRSAGANVAIVNVRAYRNSHQTQASVLDVAAAVAVTATNTTAVSVTGLTTATAGDLLVAMAVGGQEAAWSSFNSTTPSGASGAASLANPTTAWLERSDDNSTSGADTSLATFDAVKTTAGATGNFTATASLGASHVVIVAAFKIVDTSAQTRPTTTTGLLATNTASDLTGLGQNKALVASGASNGSWSGQSIGAAGLAYASFFTASGIPSTNGLNTKWAEVTLDISGGNANLRYSAQLTRVNSSGVVQAVAPASDETTSGATGFYDLRCYTTNLGTFVSGDRLEIRVCARNITANIGQSFTLTYIRARVDGTAEFGYTGIKVPFADSTMRWSYGDSGSIAALSGSDLTWTKGTASSNVYDAVRATVSADGVSGYFEATPAGVVSAAFYAIGLANADSEIGGRSSSYLGLGGDDSIGYYADGSLYISEATALTAAAYTSGDLLCFAFTNTKLWVRKGAAGNWNNDVIANQNPVGNVGGVNISAITAPLFPAAAFRGTSEAVTVNFDGPFTGAVPSGFTKVDGSAVSSPQTLTPSLFTETDTFFSPTITLYLVPGLFTETDTFFTPVVTVGAVTLVPALFTESDTFFAPAVTRGAVTLTPSLFTESDTFFTPVLSTTYAVAPSLYTESDTFFTQVVAAGAVTLVPALFTETDTFFTPVISVGAVTLLPALFTEADVFFAPTVSHVLTAALYTETDTFFTPTITVGAVTLLPALFTESDVFFTPIVDGTGLVTLAPNLFTETDTFFAPTVTPGSVTLTPSLYTEADVFFAPAVTRGAVTLVPSLFTESDVFFTPTVTRGAVALVPGLYIESDIFFASTVSQGAVTLVPALFTEADTYFTHTLSATYAVTAPLFTENDVFFTPVITTGAIALVPALYVESDTFYTHSISLFAAVDLTPALYVETDFFYSPSITVTEFGVITSGWESQVGVWRKTGRAGRTGKRYRIYR